MKKVIASMSIMFLLIGWPFGGLWGVLFSNIMGGGVEQSYVYPIYVGVVLLTGLIVGCTQIICDEIKKLRNDLEIKNGNPTDCE